MKHSKHSKKRVIKSLQSCCAVVAAGLFIGAVYPDAVLASNDNPKIDYGLTAGLSSMTINNTHFGLGQLGVYFPTWGSTDIARTEGYFAPSANLLWKTSDSGTVYGGLRAVGSITRGDGDSWGLTVGQHHDYVLGAEVGENMSYLNLDKIYLGWKSGNNISFLDTDGLDISVGKQNFQLGDGMVLTDGNDEASPHKGIYWLDPRQAWNNSAIVRLKSLPYQLELFYLQSNTYIKDEDPTADIYKDSILGGNFELVDKKLGKVGVSYFKVASSNNPMRDGLSVTGLHSRGNPVSTLQNLELAGEVDFQKNNNSYINRDAVAWFAEAKYFMPSLPWYPTLGYRYSSFSGDKASTSKNEGWDYLYNGSTERGFGYWYQGIVVGTYETRLSNLDTHFVNLTLIPPVKGSWMKVFYYNYQFNDPSTAQVYTNAAVSSNKFASEWDFILGYSPTQKVDYMLIYGSAKPAQGGIERVSGSLNGFPIGLNNKTATMLQFTMLYHM